MGNVLSRFLFVGSLFSNRRYANCTSGSVFGHPSSSGGFVTVAARRHGNTAILCHIRGIIYFARSPVPLRAFLAAGAPPAAHWEAGQNPLEALTGDRGTLFRATPLLSVFPSSP